jgi:hypothetical protein
MLRPVMCCVSKQKCLLPYLNNFQSQTMSRLYGFNSGNGFLGEAVAFNGPAEAIWSMHPQGSGANLSATPMLAPRGVPLGAVAAAAGAAGTATGAMLRPVAASIGGIGMTNVYEVAAATGNDGYRAADPADPFLTQSSFGPYTNASVMAVDARAAVIPSPLALPVSGQGIPQGVDPASIYGGFRPPYGAQPIPGTAYSFIGAENQMWLQGMQSLQGPGPYNGIASYPTSSFIVNQAGWEAGPWNGALWGLGNPLSLAPPSKTCPCVRTSAIPGQRYPLGFF